MAAFSQMDSGEPGDLPAGNGFVAPGLYGEGARRRGRTPCARAGRGLGNRPGLWGLEGFVEQHGSFSSLRSGGLLVERAGCLEKWAGISYTGI
jgi:hypothetical protein